MICVATVGCGAKTSRTREERQQIIEGLSLSQSVGGIPAWTLKSRLARLREDEKTASLEAPAMEFIRKGRVVSRVTALSGEVATDTHNVILSSSVVLQSYDDHSILRTQQLNYSSKEGHFFTHSDVAIRRPGAVIHGQGLEATPDLSEIKIFQQRSVLSGKPH